MAFDYFYNQEVEQHIFFQMPHLLFENNLNTLSINAKFLYSVLLERAKLSYKNGWLDDKGRVYIQYAQADLIKLLNCGRTKMSEYFGELDEAKGGVGLIERKQKNGIGKGDIIYVKNFASSLDEDIAEGSQFGYFHNMDNLRFKYFQVPKMLFVDENIRNISNIAKMIYVFLLDRSMLSAKNGWKDKDGRIYVLFPQKELQELVGCSERTIRKALNELDIKSGVGLIDRTRQGMNSPDMIYLLDYTTNLKYSNSESCVETVENVDTVDNSSVFNSVNIGAANPEHQEVQNLNIGAAKSEHRSGKIRTPERQNLNIGAAKSEHIYNSNTNYSNPYYNNPNSVNQSNVQPTELVEKRQTDRQTNYIPFSDVLSMLGYDYAQYMSYEPKSEADLSFYDEEQRHTQLCTIPYSLKSNRTAMIEALKFLFAHSYYSSDSTEERNHLLEAVILSLAEMVEQDVQEYQKERVHYYTIIDRINDIVHTTSLMDWFVSFEQEWSRILSEQKIKYKRAYMKSCIWNWLKDYQLDESCMKCVTVTHFNENEKEWL